VEFCRNKKSSFYKKGREISGPDKRLSSSKQEVHPVKIMYKVSVKTVISTTIFGIVIVALCILKSVLFTHQQARFL
jgi:hypothetical protein